MTLKKMGAALVVTMLMVVAAPMSASAATIAFDCITNNSGSCSSFEGFFSGELALSDSGNTLTATFSNTGSDGVITQVYADGNILADLIGINDDPLDVDFVEDSGNLPSGETVGFDANFAISAAPPPTQRGVNDGEEVGLVFSLTSPLTEESLQALLDSDALRFGIHVQSLGLNEESEAMVNDGPGTPTVVPEPATMLLLGSGLLIAARARRRKTT